MSGLNIEQLEIVDAQLGICEGHLYNPSLNPDIFVGNRARIRVLTDVVLHGGDEIPPLDLFQLQSLHDFCSIQLLIADAIKSVLIKERNDGDRDVDIWKTISSNCVEFRKRHIANHNALIKAIPALAQRIPKGDTASTRSFFTIELQTRFDAEHHLRFAFRDSEYVGWSRE